MGDIAQATAYDQLLVDHGEKLNFMRNNLISEVKEIYDDLVNKLINENKRAEIFYDLNIYLKSGFNNKVGLMASITSANDVDLKRKITTVGPHKADVIFKSKDLLIKDIFSRGEQKLLSILWSLSQNIYLGRSFNLNPILLLDDLSSELDSEMLSCFIPSLKYIENRFVFSNIVDLFDSKISTDKQSFKKFHVEQLK